MSHPPHVPLVTVTMSRRYRWIGLTAATGFLAIGLVSRLHVDTATAVSGVLVAVVFSVCVFLGPPRIIFPCALAATAGIALVGDARSSDLGWFAICVLAAWCVLEGGQRAGLTYLAGCEILFGYEWLVAQQDPGWGAWIAGTALTVLAAMLVRHQLVLVQRLNLAHAGLAERSRAEERDRIARELHDVLAHSLTVSLLHVSSARLAVEHDPAGAARALAEAERLGRQALTEVRATMGFLHTTGGDPIAPPVPGIAALPRLIDQIRQAGADISLALDGDFADLPATTGSTIYRIVQEALTNATRHAPGSPVAVRATAMGDHIAVQIDSAGPPGRGSGMGVANMRGRAEAIGGTCTAGPNGPGWLVSASLPRAQHPGMDAP